MSSLSYIDHTGFITSVERGFAHVTLVSASACASCSAKALCGVGDSEQKHFSVSVKGDQWHVGDEVIVRLQTQHGFLALLLGYVIPLLLVVISLIILLATGVREGPAGLLSLAILLPYYASLVIIKRWIHRRIKLTILKR